MVTLVRFFGAQAQQTGAFVEWISALARCRPLMLVVEGASLPPPRPCNSARRTRTPRTLQYLPIEEHRMPVPSCVWSAHLPHRRLRVERDSQRTEGEGFMPRETT